jgi:hypothetical protein
MGYHFTQEQVDGLYKLLVFKEIFYGIEPTQYKELIQQFIDIFCSHNLADTDYAMLLSEVFQFPYIEQWIRKASLDAIGKYLTYIIWTDKIVSGFFASKIKDNTLKHIINRIEFILRNQLQTVL